MAQVYLQKGGRIRLVEEERVSYWEKQGFKRIPEEKKKRTTKPKTEQPQD